jgi:Domain of unknown function (DUF3488).
MSPGDFTNLLTDDRPAMRVGFDGAPPSPDQRYFRAYVMWNYDGSRWTYVDIVHRAPVELQIIRSVGYQISMEPTHRQVLPMLDVPIDAPGGSAMRRDRVVMADRPVNDPLTYAARSAVQYRLQPELGLRERNLGLFLPDRFNPRTLALGREWRQRYGGDDAAIVQAALALFHDGGFRYTLSPAPARPRRDGRFPVRHP